MICYGKRLIKMNNEHKKYLNKILWNKRLVLFTQIFIFIAFIILWQIASDKKWINSFFFVADWKIDWYNTIRGFGEMLS